MIQRVAPTLKAASAGFGPLSESEWSTLERDLAWLASRLWPSRYEGGVSGAPHRRGTWPGWPPGCGPAGTRGG